MTKSEIKTSSVSVISVDKAVGLLGGLFVNAIKSATPFQKLPAIMLWGKPGVGKSQGVRQLASYITAKTGKQTFVTDVRLLLFNPIDLRGIPVADVTHSFAVWLRPKIFDMNPSDEIVNILFLDEITAAPPSVQAAAYQITLDRIIGEHRLPDNCMVIAAGNRVTDKSVAFKMPKALANRLCHIEIDSDFDAWVAWAQKSGIDDRVRGFLKSRRELLCSFEPSNDDVAFATPRSWEMVSNVLLNGCYSSPRDCFGLIAGLVGAGIASEFCGWCDINAKLPEIEDVINGNCTLVPKSADALYATIKLIKHYLGANIKNRSALRNCILYSYQFPPDFTAVFFKELLSISEEARTILMATFELTDWIRKHAKFFQ